jgi:putative endonuclease
MFTKIYYVYILASKRGGTLYIGVTNNLLKREQEHGTDVNKDSFTARYGVHRLVYFEICEDIAGALLREKQLKKWNRQWKIELIEKENPNWEDLTEKLSG